VTETGTPTDLDFLCKVAKENLVKYGVKNSFFELDHKSPSKILIIHKHYNLYDINRPNSIIYYLFNHAALTVEFTNCQITGKNNYLQCKLPENAGEENCHGS
jgi:hypothetical protein